MRAIVWKNPPEFPSDNPELWRPRAPAASVELLIAEVAVAAETETETASASGTETASEAETESEIDVHVEVVDFDDSDFAHAEDGSIPPPPPPESHEVVIVAEAVAETVAAADAVSDSDSDSDSASVSASEPAQPDLFAIYVRTLVEVALAAGAPARAVEALPGMLGHARLDTQSLDDATIDALVRAGMLARTDSGAVVRADTFVATAQAWKASLLGEEAEFSCSAMLDEWSALIVATLAGAPQRQESLRRDLRARGVAAFGLLVDAA